MLEKSSNSAHARSGVTFRWLYLAVVLDFFSRKVLGYAFSDSLESGITCKALIKAVGNHRLHSSLAMDSPDEFIAQRKLAA